MSVPLPEWLTAAIEISQRDVVGQHLSCDVIAVSGRAVNVSVQSEARDSGKYSSDSHGEGKAEYPSHAAVSPLVRWRSIVRV